MICVMFPLVLIMLATVLLFVILVIYVNERFLLTSHISFVLKNDSACSWFNVNELVLFLFIFLTYTTDE